MLRRWGRKVWRFLEPWLAELVWLDPAVAAAVLNPEPSPAPAWRLVPRTPSEPVLAPREAHNVA